MQFLNKSSNEKDIHFVESAVFKTSRKYQWKI